MAAKKQTLHHECAIVRTILVTHYTLNMSTGAKSEDRQEWVTRPCGSPLFSDDDRATGRCKSCDRGWNHPDNYRADGPRPEVVEGESASGEAERTERV